MNISDELLGKQKDELKYLCVFQKKAPNNILTVKFENFVPWVQFVFAFAQIKYF